MGHLGTGKKLQLLALNHQSIFNVTLREINFQHTKSQEELDELISICLKDKIQLNFVEFKELIENVCSDMFLCVSEY